MINRRQFVAAGILLASTRPAPAAAGADYAQLLASAVKPDGAGYNRVDYAFLSARKSALDGLVTGMQAARPSTFGRAAQMAYWINLYNAATLQVVVAHYPVKSIRDINLGGGGLFGSGPWSRPLLTVEGRPLSLDAIENDMLRKQFGDPLIHYALNCASRSCPNLAAAPYAQDTIDAMMRDNARAYVNHPRGVAVSQGAITASKIYSWYAADFGGKAKLKDHWISLSAPDKAAEIAAARLSKFAYDWSLNDV